MSSQVSTSFHSQGGFAHVYIVQSQTPINGTRQHVLKRMAVPDESMLREVKQEVDVMVRRRVPVSLCID